MKHYNDDLGGGGSRKRVDELLVCVALLVLVHGLFGCKARDGGVQVVPVDGVQVLVGNRELRDVSVELDSTRQYHRGDTVVSVVYRWRDRRVVEHDTVVDSVRVPVVVYPKKEEVEKTEPFMWRLVRDGVLPLLVIGVILLAIRYLLRKILRL